jgi:hypothetical protein
MPECEREDDRRKLTAVYDTMFKHCSNYMNHTFDAPEHKQATYAQCARLFGGALDLPDDEVLVTSDIDMLCFGNVFRELSDGNIHIIGADLLDESMKQIPMCYISATAKQWREVMKVNGRSYQQCLDESVGAIECQDFRGNQWSLDQHTAYNHFYGHSARLHSRAKMPERFAKNRIDRDDAYFMERLSPDILDYHAHRPGYTDENFEKIISVIQYFYPNDDLSWMRSYQQEYKKLLR